MKQLHVAWAAIFGLLLSTLWIAGQQTRIIGFDTTSTGTTSFEWSGRFLDPSLATRGAAGFPEPDLTLDRDPLEPGEPSDEIIAPSIPPPNRPPWSVPVDDTTLPEASRYAHLRGWKLNLPGDQPPSPPAAGDGLVFTGSGVTGRLIYAVDLVTGVPIWTWRVSDSRLGAPVISNGILVIAAQRSATLALDPETGRLLWGHRFSEPLANQPSVAGALVLQAHPADTGIVLSAWNIRTGETAWSLPIDGDIIGYPVAGPGVTHFTTVPGTVYRIRTRTGRIQWAEPVGANSPPWVSRERLIFSTVNPWANLRSRTRTGLLVMELSGEFPAATYLWGPRETFRPEAPIQALQLFSIQDRVESPASTLLAEGRIEALRNYLGFDRLDRLWFIPDSRPVVSEEHLFLLHPDRLRCLDDQGGVRWEARLDSGEQDAVWFGPVCAGDQTIVNSSDGLLMAFDSDSGEIAWQVRIDEQLSGPPVLFRGWMILTGPGGLLMGLNTQNMGLTDWDAYGGGPGRPGASVSSGRSADSER